MDFDLEKDIAIFDQFFKSRPEVSLANLKQDLTRYYLPYLQKLIKFKKHSSEGLIVGVSAIQGAGKTTQGEILEILLRHFKFTSASLSIDDHYITHQELCKLRARDPRFIRRGVTHDLSLAILNLRDLKQMQKGEYVLVSGYDKGAHFGDGDRFRWVEPIDGLVIRATIVSENLMVNKSLQNVQALRLRSLEYNSQTIFLPNNMGSDIPLAEHFLSNELVTFLEKIGEKEVVISLDEQRVLFAYGNDVVSGAKEDLPKGWHLITKKPDFIFYDGWMLGARRITDESVFSASLPALETFEAQQFAKDVNKKLENYEVLWEMIEFTNVLYVLNYQMSLKWRDQAEEVLRARGEGMNSDQIREFVYYFWRSVHPGIHIKNLAYDSTHANQVVIINDDHSVGEVLTPEEVKFKYP